jgi:hypothetical protein
MCSNSYALRTPRAIDYKNHRSSLLQSDIDRPKRKLTIKAAGRSCVTTLTADFVFKAHIIKASKVFIACALVTRRKTSVKTLISQIRRLEEEP